MGDAHPRAFDTGGRRDTLAVRKPAEVNAAAMTLDGLQTARTQDVIAVQVLAEVDAAAMLHAAWILDRLRTGRKDMLKT